MSMSAGCWRVLRLLFALSVCPAAALAQGGPPLMTDDPDTPGPGHWEINIAMLVDTSPEARRLEMPRLDINYGVGNRLQLKVELPWVRYRDGDRPSNTDMGSAVAGVKWRFLGQEGRRIAWSIYPQYTFRTTRSAVAKGISDTGPELLLPTELTVEIAHVEVNGEIGRSIVAGGAGRQLIAVSTEAGVRQWLEFVGEIHSETVVGKSREVFANVGARPKLTQQIVVLLAAGRTIHDRASEQRSYVYAGMQLNLPGRSEPANRQTREKSLDNQYLHGHRVSGM
jgi:hypothetical protein